MYKKNPKIGHGVLRNSKFHDFFNHEAQKEKEKRGNTGCTVSFTCFRANCVVEKLRNRKGKLLHSKTLISDLVGFFTEFNAESSISKFKQELGQTDGRKMPK